MSAVDRPPYYAAGGDRMLVAADEAAKAFCADRGPQDDCYQATWDAFDSSMDAALAPFTEAPA
ncbi:hypothetical protein [Streptomyces sp. NPDC093261]|uniref:hypothetical protein n=1 Tax=Streptomyces sp. NPDC093261 TaxID=3366037 RepID=UPI00382B930F